MKKRFIQKAFVAFMALTLLIGSFAGCGSGNTSDSSSSSGQSESESSAAADSSAGTAANEKPYHIVMAHMVDTGDFRDLDEVVAAINELTLRELNMTFEVLQLGWGDSTTKLNLMLAGGDKLDIFPISADLAAGYISAGQIVDLNDYIYDYGQDILDQLGEDVATSGAVNGFVYGTPSNKESASLSGVIMRKDIVDELGIDIDAIHTLDDLTDIYAKVKEAYPSMDCLSGTNLVGKWEDHDPLTDRFGVLMDDGQDTTVVNWYETDAYRIKVGRINEWYQAGYIKLDAATTTDSAQSLVKAGSLFSFIGSIKPGYLVQANNMCGREMVYAYIGHDDGTTLNNLNTNNVNFINWGIPQSCEDKVKAMQFLNFAYSNSEFMNLLNWGIEGEHYVKVDGSDNVIDYPEGVDANNTGYRLDMGWHLPNQFIAHIWNGLPEDIWDQYREFNDSAQKSKAFGFLYDPTSVSTELTALQSVKAEYTKALETGSVPDVDATLKDFNDKLYAAGLQKVMDLKQEQLDAWLAKQS